MNLEPKLAKHFESAQFLVLVSVSLSVGYFRVGCERIRNSESRNRLKFQVLGGIGIILQYW